MEEIDIIARLEEQKPSIKLHKPTITVTCQVISSITGSPMQSAQLTLAIGSTPQQILTADEQGYIKFTMTRELWEGPSKLLFPENCTAQLHLPEIFTVTRRSNGPNDAVSPLDLQHEECLAERGVKIYHPPVVRAHSYLSWLLQIKEELEATWGIPATPFGIIILSKEQRNVSIMAELPIVPIEAEAFQDFLNTKWAWIVIHEWIEISLAPKLFYIGGSEKPLELASHLRFISDGLAEFITYRIALRHASGATRYRLENYSLWIDELFQKGINQYELTWFQSVVEGKEVVSPLEEKYGYPISFQFWHDLEQKNPGIVKRFIACFMEEQPQSFNDVLKILERETGPVKLQIDIQRAKQTFEQLKQELS